MAVDAFIKIEGIQGASTSSKHKGEIEVLSFSWGIKNETSSGGGGGAGKATVSDVTFTKEVAKDSPALFVSVCKGEHHKEAVFTVEGLSTERKAGREQSFFKVTMEDVLISSVSLGGQDNSVPLEQVSLSFAKVQLEYGDGKGGGSAVEVCDFRSEGLLDR